MIGAAGVPALFDAARWPGVVAVGCHGRVSFIRDPGSDSDDQLRARVNAPGHAAVRRDGGFHEFGPPYTIVACTDTVSFIRDRGTDDDQLRALVGAPPDAVVLWFNPDGFDTDLLTWSCHVCHRERLDQFISVAPRPLAGAAEIPGAVYNVRYCNDCPPCVAVATTAPHWPLTEAVGYCVPAHGLHASPHRGCGAQAVEDGGDTPHLRGKPVA